MAINIHTLWGRPVVHFSHARQSRSPIHISQNTRAVLSTVLSLTPVLPSFHPFLFLGCVLMDSACEIWRRKEKSLWTGVSHLWRCSANEIEWAKHSKVWETEVCAAFSKVPEPLPCLPLSPKGPYLDDVRTGWGWGVPKKAHRRSTISQWRTSTRGIEVAQKCSVSNEAQADLFSDSIWIWELNHRISLPLLHYLRNIFVQPLSPALTYLIFVRGKCVCEEGLKIWLMSYKYHP